MQNPVSSLFFYVLIPGSKDQNLQGRLHLHNAGYFNYSRNTQQITITKN